MLISGLSGRKQTSDLPTTTRYEYSYFFCFSFSFFTFSLFFFSLGFHLLGISASILLLYICVFLLVRYFLQATLTVSCSQLNQLLQIFFAFLFFLYFCVVICTSVHVEMYFCFSCNHLIDQSPLPCREEKETKYEHIPQVD